MPAEMPARDVTLSIVSHRQNELVNRLLDDIERCCAHRVALLLTENLAEQTPLATAKLSCPVKTLRNQRIRGFGANHNAAFAFCETPYFCVVNPDLRLPNDPFPTLVESLQRENAAAAGPLVRNPAGAIEDSARHFPTVGSLLRKLLRPAAGPDYPTNRGPFRVDWVAGMFMLFSSAAYRRIGGFDERYFLYYEDVDICRRLGKAGRPIIYDPRAEVIHDARRASRREIRHAWHHLSSVLRFLARSG